MALGGCWEATVKYQVVGSCGLQLLDAGERALFRIAMIRAADVATTKWAEPDTNGPSVVIHTSLIVCLEGWHKVFRVGTARKKIMMILGVRKKFPGHQNWCNFPLFIMTKLVTVRSFN